MTFDAYYQQMFEYYDGTKQNYDYDTLRRYAQSVTYERMAVERISECPRVH